MKTVLRLLPWIVLVAAAGAYAWGVVQDDWLVRMIAKPFPVLMLLLVVGGRKRGPYQLAIAAGLVSSLGGDMLLETSPSGLFVPGLLAFLVAHLFYIVAFTWSRWRIALLRAVPAYGFGAVMYVIVAGGLGTMAAPVALYTFVICTMLWRAAARVKLLEPSFALWIGFVGAALFVTSDSLIAIDQFHTALGHPEGRLAILATYWLGQTGIALSVPRRKRRVS